MSGTHDCQTAWAGFGRAAPCPGCGGCGRVVGGDPARSGHATCDGFGLMLAEAMAAGCPVVASHVGAIPEVAAGAAVLVPPDDPDALATALTGLDAPLRRDLRETG